MISWGGPEYWTTTVNVDPSTIPLAGVTTSFIGCVSPGSVLSTGVASTCWNAAPAPFTVTESTSRSWKSRLNSDRFWVAVASIVVVASLKTLRSGS